MSQSIFTSSYTGLNSQIIEVEADVSNHLPGFILVGLPDAAVQEARERIRSALENSNLPFPRSKITVNLAPADVRKEGSVYDVAIAVAVLLAQGAIEYDFSNSVFLGELALNGQVRPIRGVLLMTASARDAGFRYVFVPEKNAREAAYVPGITVIPVRSLSDLIAHLKKQNNIQPTPAYTYPESRVRATTDFSEIKGQAIAKRALEIAAAGGHNVILDGLPGTGKTLLAKSIPSILPPLRGDEVLEVSKIYSAAGLLSHEQPLVIERPFRSPHHTSSVTSLVGGGSIPRPGEITLAHHGILFLDELPEYPRNVLESLRQPLEDRVVSISRAAGRYTFPASFMLIGTKNPCPCGAFGSREKECTCTAYQVSQYQKRLSGPLLDRIDLFITVDAIDKSQLLDSVSGEQSATIRERVVRAREVQSERYGSGKLNSVLSHTNILESASVSSIAKPVLLKAVDSFSLSPRSLFRLIRVARTIADLEKKEHVSEDHVLEAIQFRGSR